VGAIAVLLLLAAATAAARQLRVAEIVIDGEGGFAPKALPKHENAPITIHGGGRVSTTTGKPPPVLETIEIDFDRHGPLDTTGLEVCTTAKLQATTVAQARRNCQNAISARAMATRSSNSPSPSRSRPTRRSPSSMAPGETAITPSSPTHTPRSPSRLPSSS
jgi:hypothetical protein